MKKTDLFQHISDVLHDKIIAYRKIHPSSRRTIYEVLSENKNQYIVKICSLIKNKEELSLEQEWENYDSIPEGLSKVGTYYTRYQDIEVLIIDFIPKVEYDDNYIQSLGLTLGKINKRESLQSFNNNQFLGDIKDTYQKNIKVGLIEKSYIDFVYIYLYHGHNKFLEKVEKLYVSHGDLHTNNVLRSSSGGIKLIDWETLGYRIKEMDMISAIYFHQFDSRQAEVLFGWYGYPIGEKKYQRLTYLYIYYIFKELPLKRHFSKLEYKAEIAMLCTYIH